MSESIDTTCNMGSLSLSSSLSERFGEESNIESPLLSELRNGFFGHLVGLCQTRADQQLLPIAQLALRVTRLNSALKHWVVRKSNAQYDIFDCQFPGFVFSVTSLHGLKQTNGHRHKHPELYFVLKGSGKLLIDGAATDFSDKGSSFYIPGGSFHQVVNESAGDINFLCYWEMLKVDDLANSLS